MKYTNKIFFAIFASAVSLSAFYLVNSVKIDNKKLPMLRKEIDSIGIISTAKTIRSRETVNKMTYSYIADYYEVPIPPAAIFEYYDRELRSNGWQPGASFVRRDPEKIYCKNNLMAKIDVYKTEPLKTTFLIDISSGGIDFEVCGAKVGKL